MLSLGIHAYCLRMERAQIGRTERNTGSAFRKQPLFSPIPCKDFSGRRSLCRRVSRDHHWSLSCEPAPGNLVHRIFWLRGPVCRLFITPSATGLFDAGGCPKTEGIRSIREFLQDVFCQKLVDLPVAGNRLRCTRLWVPIPVVIAAVANELAACSFQLSDQVCPHPTGNSATRRMPGISALVRSL